MSHRANLPFPKHQAKYHRELEAAIDAVDRASRLCVDVKRSLFSSKDKILEKNDQTPVTIADFGVQALVSLGKNNKKRIRLFFITELKGDVVEIPTLFFFFFMSDLQSYRNCFLQYLWSLKKTLFSCVRTIL